MSDYFYARITIGGTIEHTVSHLYNTSVLDQIANYIIENNLIDYESDTVIKTKEIFNKIIEEQRTSSELTIYDEEVRWGEFEFLETLLRKHNLEYKRFTLQDHSEGPYVTYWKPGMDKPKTVCCDFYGEPIIPVRAIKGLINKKAELSSLLDNSDIPDLLPLVIK